MTETIIYVCETEDEAYNFIDESKRDLERSQNQQRRPQMTKHSFICLSQAFNAMCKSVRIDGPPFTASQRQIIFDQLALTCSNLGTTFCYDKFEDACRKELVNDFPT